MRYFLGIPIKLTDELVRFRNHYDIRASVLEPHITIIPPFEEEKLTGDFIAHVESVVTSTTKTVLVTTGVLITEQGHIFYMLDQNGNRFLEDLYQKLCAFPDFLSMQQSPLLPHIMLGKIRLSWLDERFREEIEALCVPQQFPIELVRLYKSVGWRKKRLIIQDFHFS
jgi:2'-5' RNA ligase